MLTGANALRSLEDQSPPLSVVISMATKGPEFFRLKRIKFTVLHAYLF